MNVTRGDELRDLPAGIFEGGSWTCSVATAVGPMPRTVLFTIVLSKLDCRSSKFEDFKVIASSK